ncbi:hypothetical protein [Sandaracinus amylolyticus]|uniref:Uncharacterized protein n=1 Tax=Sandaracinus amylolyticus TaxID=927083 RepID=A0A0F6W1S9_9BACT|nr:hypothetical protein [Sandaracinus amylolyticus]AKF05306.1 hypothetical protein DB32_002455 [Sandaracinus amylolyticus]
MPRYVLAALAIATLSLSGGRAAADDCMCLGPETLFPAASVVEIADVLESPDDTIETVDRTAPDPEVTPEPARPRGPVAWCRSADDPRCQRDDARETSHRETLRHAPLATILTTPRIARAGVTLVRFPRAIARGPSGVAFRLDRPPRA